MVSSVFNFIPEDLKEKIKQSKILVVGAGGIGCEVLKNLVMCNFPDIEIIDMDTIDLSNLNRQFLFHHEHIGKPKAIVARMTAMSFNPNVKITAHNDSVMSENFGVNYFKQFTLVLNALDNRAARNHVNRLCLNAEVPLIESGTAGFSGQVELINKGVTQCYECIPKPAPKTFPGCTIRNTPSEPIHCIVWAKHLFNQLFGEVVDDEDVSPDYADPETLKDSADSTNIVRINTRQWAKQHNYDAEALFNKFFYDDIKYLLSMTNLWKTRKPPTFTKWEDVYINNESTEDNLNYRQRYFEIWTLQECANAFKECLISLREEVQKNGENYILVWDKDERSSMDFVAAAANIRAHLFSIKQTSRFEAKSMAGNIIPAVATTNAVTAGLVVLRVFNLLRNQMNECKSIYIRDTPNARLQLLAPDKKLIPPNPKCYVCSSERAIHLRTNTNSLKLIDFRNKVLIHELNMVNPDVMIESTGAIVLSSDEEETADNESKTLHQLHIVDGVILKCDDFLQNYTLRIIIMDVDVPRDNALYEIIADESQIKTKDQIEIVDSNNKKTIDEEDEDEYTPPSKRRKHVITPDDNDSVCIVDLENGNKNGEPMKINGGNLSDDLILLENSDDEECNEKNNSTKESNNIYNNNNGNLEEINDANLKINIGMKRKSENPKHLIEIDVGNQEVKIRIKKMCIDGKSE